MPGSWRLPTWLEETYDDGAPDRWHPRLEEREVKPWTTLWSSQWPDADGLHAHLVEKWKATYGVTAD